MLELELKSCQNTIGKQRSDFESLVKATEIETKELQAGLQAKEREIKINEETQFVEIQRKDNQISELKKRLGCSVEKEKKLEKRLNTFDTRELQLCNRLRVQDEVRRALHNRVMQLSGNIRVYVRVRPCIADESSTLKELPFTFPTLVERQHRGSPSSMSLSNNSCDDIMKGVIVAEEPEKDRGGLNPRRKKWKFGFDNVFTPKDNQEDVWQATQPLVQSAIDGWNVTLFAYGQTGSGKTYVLFYIIIFHLQ